MASRTTRRASGWWKTNLNAVISELVNHQMVEENLPLARPKA